MEHEHVQSSQDDLTVDSSVSTPKSVSEEVTISDLYRDFENYKKQRETQLNERMTAGYEVDMDLQELRTGIDVLRNHINDLKTEISALVIQDDSIEIPKKVFGMSTESPCPKCRAKQIDPSEMDKALVITCRSTTCLFENCNRRMDSQLMLLHYLTDHSGDRHTYSDCHAITEGETCVLSFFPQQCHFGENRVLGLLTYAGTIEENAYRTNKNVIFNSFLPKPFEYLEAHIPIVVMICKTTTSAALKDKQLAKRLNGWHNLENQLFVVWLVSPNNMVHINATLSVCGRDPIDIKSTIIAVRHVCHTQNTRMFMPIDNDYWRLPYKEVQKMSNGFRDQLNLEISLARVDQPI